MTTAQVKPATILAIEKRLDEGSPIAMRSTPQILRNNRVYNGRIFAVDDRDILLQTPEQDSICINRQVVRHPDSVFLLAHDCMDGADRYLIEREYRVGAHAFSFGIPAGLCAKDEDPIVAAVRELEEETGVICDPSSSDVIIETVGTFYPSQGMTDERAHIMIAHLQNFKTNKTQFDPDEYVESGWVSWEELLTLPVKGALGTIAIQHEHIRRLTHSQPNPFKKS